MGEIRIDEIFIPESNKNIHIAFIEHLLEPESFLNSL